VKNVISVKSNPLVRAVVGWTDLDRTYTRSQKSMGSKKSVKKVSKLISSLIYFLERYARQFKVEKWEKETEASKKKGGVVLGTRSKYTNDLGEFAIRFSHIYSRVQCRPWQRNGSLLHLFQLFFSQKGFSVINKISKRFWKINRQMHKLSYIPVIHFFKFFKELLKEGFNSQDFFFNTIIQ